MLGGQIDLNYTLILCETPLLYLPLYGSILHITEGLFLAILKAFQLGVSILEIRDNSQNRSHSDKGTNHFSVRDNCK